MSLSVGFSRSSNTGFVSGCTSQQSDFNINTCMNRHTHLHPHSNMPRHTHSNTHPSMAGQTQTHGRPSVPNFSMTATQAFLDSPTEDTQHYIGKNTSFSSRHCETSRLFSLFSPQKPAFKVYLDKLCFPT